MADAKNIEILISQLADFQTRHVARKEIEAMGEEVADCLLPLLTDSTLAENMRWSALSLFVAWKYAPATEAILEVARTDRGLHSEAFRALERITGLTIGEDADEWEKALADPASYVAQGAVEKLFEEGDEKEEENAGYNLLRRAVGSIASEFRWEDEGYLYMRFELPGGRKQQMIATFEETDPSGNPLTTIYTECGPANPQIKELINRRNVTVKHGKFVLDGDGDEQKVVMRELIPTSRLTEDLAHEVLLSMAADADALENELTHADHI